MLIGFSTGFLYKDKEHDHVSLETVNLVRSLGCNAIEFMTRDMDHLKRILNNIGRENLTGFEFVSLHAPEVIFRETLTQSVEGLKIIQAIYEKIKLNNVVVHPDEVNNWDIFSQFSFPLAIENMDDRKNSHRNIKDMQEALQVSGAKMVLDLNHCFVNDQTMKLAHDFFDEFENKINEIHLSGENFHEPLFQTKTREIQDVIFNINLPIIIESGCDNIGDAKKEFDYVKNCLNSKIY